MSSSSGQSSVTETNVGFRRTDVEKLQQQGVSLASTPGAKLDKPKETSVSGPEGSKFLEDRKAQLVNPDQVKALISSFTQRRTDILRRRRQPGVSGLNLSGR